VMIVTSDLITDIPDLTRQELRENMQQIRSTAYEMNSIINNLLLFAEVRHVALLIEPVEMAKAVVNVRNRLSYMIKKQRARVIIPESWPDAIGFRPWTERCSQTT
jgi:light-regulated signal transduction histidine kinase (bacteriophytochrome)